MNSKNRTCLPFKNEEKIILSCETKYFQLWKAISVSSKYFAYAFRCF